MSPEEAIKIIESECYVANLMNLDRTRMVNTALDVAVKALKSQLQQRNCESCKHSNNGRCAYTEECHECMWGNKYEPQCKRGKWIFSEKMGHQYCCSECGLPMPNVNEYYRKKIIGCPYCLADMRGDADDE